MRILTDENISPVIVAALEAADHNVLAVTTAMPAAPDDAVMERAVAEGASWSRKTRTSANWRSDAATGHRL